MEDYIEAKKREIKRGYLNEEHLITLKWPYTEWCDFWCEAAGICIKKLRKWADATKEQIESGIFILRGFNGSWKEIYMSLDEERALEILEKAKKINEHVEKRTYPDPLWETNPDDLSICLACPYKHMCMTEMQGSEKIIFREDNELLIMLKERAELEEYAKRYEESRKLLLYLRTYKLRCLRRKKQKSFLWSISLSLNKSFIGRLNTKCLKK